jgi:hypothetical protein
MAGMGSRRGTRWTSGRAGFGRIHCGALLDGGAGAPVEGVLDADAGTDRDTARALTGAVLQILADASPPANSSHHRAAADEYRPLLGAARTGRV